MLISPNYSNYKTPLLPHWSSYPFPGLRRSPLPVTTLTNDQRELRARRFNFQSSPTELALTSVNSMQRDRAVTPITFKNEKQF